MSYLSPYHIIRWQEWIIVFKINKVLHSQKLPLFLMLAVYWQYHSVQLQVVANLLRLFSHSAGNMYRTYQIIHTNTPCIYRWIIVHIWYMILQLCMWIYMNNIYKMYTNIIHTQTYKHMWFMCTKYTLSVTFYIIYMSIMLC